jgi:hypothetical protein
MSEVIYFADRLGKKPSPRPGSEEWATLRAALYRASTEDPSSDMRGQGLAERALAIVAAKNLELPELKNRWWQGERRTLVQCILAMRSDFSESSAHTCARNILDGHGTFDEVANGTPPDVSRLAELHDAWKTAEAAYKTALEEESKRSGQNRTSVGQFAAKARKKARKQSGTPDRAVQWLDEIEGLPA